MEMHESWKRFKANILYRNDQLQIFPQNVAGESREFARKMPQRYYLLTNSLNCAITLLWRSFRRICTLILDVRALFNAILTGNYRKITAKKYLDLVTSSVVEREALWEFACGYRWFEDLSFQALVKSSRSPKMFWNTMN